MRKMKICMAVPRGCSVPSNDDEAKKKKEVDIWFQKYSRGYRKLVSLVM